MGIVTAPLKAVGWVGAQVLHGTAWVVEKSSKAVAYPFVKSAGATMDFVKDHKVLTAGVGMAGAGAYLLAHEDPVPTMAQRGLAELDAQGQANGAMLHTLYAAQQMSPMQPQSRVSNAQYMGGQVFAGADMSVGAAR
jgi:hypothetical protein